MTALALLALVAVLDIAAGLALIAGELYRARRRAHAGHLQRPIFWQYE